MMDQVLQGNAPWQLNFRDLTDRRINQITRYGLLYAVYAPQYDRFITLEDVQENAFWSGVILRGRTGSGGTYVTGHSLSWLLGTANETGATSGQILNEDMFALSGSSELSEEDVDRIIGSAINETTTDPATAIDQIFARSMLPSDFPLRLGEQQWEVGTTLVTEIPNWYTLMQGLNAVTGIAQPSGGWYVKPNGEIIVGTGNQIFRTPPESIVISANSEIIGNAWDTAYQAEILDVDVDASRTIGRALVVGDSVLGGVDITDNAWELGGVKSATARHRAAVIEVGGALSAEDAKLLTKRVLQSRSREEVVITMQFPARSKIVIAVKPGDVLGIIETKANWPTQPNPEAWVSYLCGYAINPYPAVVTKISIPFVKGMGIYYKSPDDDSIYDITNFVKWEEGKVTIVAGDAISTMWETLLNTSSFVEHPTAVPDGDFWEWR